MHVWLQSYGPYGYGLWYGIYSCGLRIYGLYIYDLYRYGLYSHGAYSNGGYSYGLNVHDMYIVLACLVMTYVVM